MKLNVFNFLPHCQPCLACCKNENIFLSEKERQYFGNKAGEENCHNLLDDGRCKIHENRPTECRLYPYDIKRINGKLTWIIWDSCPATSYIPNQYTLEQIKNFETNLEESWVYDYVAHHEENEPEKYSNMVYHVIKLYNKENKNDNS